MNLKFVLVPFVIVVIGLGIVSGFDLAEGQKVITKTVTGTSFVTVTTYSNRNSTINHFIYDPIYQKPSSR